MGKIRDCSKKIRDTKGTSQAKMGLIRDRNGMDLTKAEDIKKWWQKTTEELYKKISSVQFSSVAQSCPTICDPINCSMPGLPVHDQLPEFTQIHVH